jgi:hypothetical protein
MPLVLADRVKVRARTTGTGEFYLEQTVDGFQSFSVVGNGNETYYGIVDAAGNWEIGRGTYLTDSTVEWITRDNVVSSSNNNDLVNFPAGSKNVFITFPSSLATSLIADAASDSFKYISVAGQDQVVADASDDTLTLVAGTGISISTNAGSDTITITNNAIETPDIGVSDLNDTAIISPANGQVLKYNGVAWVNSIDNNDNTTYALSTETTTGGANLRLTGSDTVINNVKMAAGANMTITRTDANTITFESSGSGGSASDSFKTIAVSGQSSVVADSSTDTLTLVAGAGIALSTNATTDTITIANTQTATNSFGTIAVAGQFNVVADGLADILTLVAGTGISLTNDPTADSITITNTSTGTTYGISSETNAGGAALRLTGSNATTDEVIFAAGSNVTITRTDANIITIASTGSSGSGLQSRNAVVLTTPNIGAGLTNSSLSLVGYKSYALLKVQVDYPCWLRFYTDNASRTADLSRLESVDPNPGSGVIAEFVTTGAQTIIMSPAAIGFNNETSPTTSIPFTITNKDSVTRSITITVTLLQLES